MGLESVSGSVQLGGLGGTTILGSLPLGELGETGTSSLPFGHIGTYSRETGPAGVEAGSGTGGGATAVAGPASPGGGGAGFTSGSPVTAAVPGVGSVIVGSTDRSPGGLAHPVIGRPVGFAVPPPTRH